MTIEQRQPAPEFLVKACHDVMLRHGIKPRWEEASPRALQWLMPFELLEGWDRSLPLQMFGYPVHSEALLGETTVALLETVDMISVSDSMSSDDSPSVGHE